jgi:hypothetical protein
MKLTFGCFALVFALVACQGNDKSGTSGIKETSPHKGYGKIQTTGDQLNTFDIDSSSGDEAVCGPRDDGFQIYIGPRDYIKTEPYGLMILLPPQAKIPGQFVVNDVEPIIKFSYSLSAASGVWIPNRKNNNCLVTVVEVDKSDINVKVDCPLEEGVLSKNGRLHLTADIRCSAIAMKGSK